MASAANQDAYGNSAWNTAPPGGAPPYQGWGSQGWSNHTWAQQGWGGPPFWHPAGFSRPVGILMMILGFMFWWPFGLALLFGMIWSGRMGCWGRRRWAACQSAESQNQSWGGWKPWANSAPATPPGSGNRAFDEYRAETLRRLEDEQKEFSSFLDRLRFAKDKSEFDQFMTERRQRPTPPAPTDDANHA